jgi:HAD superfamily hydrolase (TIGR01509 family)
MIKLVIFDLDGVLVEARELHYEALNRAIGVVAGADYEINREEHLSTYDGLPTTKKLKMLTEKKGLSESLHRDIWKEKQKATLEIIDKFEIDKEKKEMLEELKSSGVKIMCATNSIRDTAKLQLIRKGFFDSIDYLYSNEDVDNPKPHPEMYLRCILKAGVSPRETLIVEDSHHGRRAALESGAHLLAVLNAKDLTKGKVFDKITELDDVSNIVKPKWQGQDMNVLIPMAGRGNRFALAGYTFPKPLVEVSGQPMIQVVTENINIDSKHIYIVQKEHYEKYNLEHVLNLISPDCDIVIVDEVTEGAACTALLAKDLINNDKPLLIANSDQFIEWDSNEFMYAMNADSTDAGILTFRSTHPKWSYAKLDENGYVCEVAEKKPISDNATVGIYFWKKGADFVKYAEQMIENNVRVNNEFYVCPVFNEAIKDGKKIKIYDVPEMWGLGTPEDLKYFLKRKYE